MWQSKESTTPRNQKNVELLGGTIPWSPGRVI